MVSTTLGNTGALYTLIEHTEHQLQFTQSLMVTGQNPVICLITNSCRVVMNCDTVQFDYVC